MPTIDRGGWPLHYEIVGDGEETIVLTHGLGSTARTWEKQVEALAGAFRVVTWDLRAHGRSGSPDEPVTLTTLADDLAAVVTATASKAVHALGHSAGGVVTMQFALEHRALARSLILAGTASECNARARAWYEALAQTAEENGGAAVLRELGGRGPEAMPPEPRGFARIARAMGSLHVSPLTERLDELDCPALVIVGEKDFLGVGGSVIISRRLRGSRLEIVPQRGHALFLEDPVGFNRLLLDFLRSQRP